MVDFYWVKIDLNDNPYTVSQTSTLNIDPETGVNTETLQTNADQYTRSGYVHVINPYTSQEFDIGYDRMQFPYILASTNGYDTIVGGQYGYTEHSGHVLHLLYGSVAGSYVGPTPPADGNFVSLQLDSLVYDSTATDLDGVTTHQHVEVPPSFDSVSYPDYYWVPAGDAPAKPPLFTEGADAPRNLSTLIPTDFTVGTATMALGGDDVVTLPGSPAKWAAWGVTPAPGGDGRVHFDAGTGNDTITGGALNDWIDGGADDDRIIGSSGNDALLGDTGNDTFEFPSNLAANTIQFMDGGSETGLIGSVNRGVDLLKLPGSPNDYKVLVEFAGTWPTTETKIIYVHGGKSKEFTLESTDIEKVEFKGALNNKISLTSGSVIAEMAKLSLEVYGNSIPSHLVGGKARANPHDFDPLAYQPGYNSAASPTFAVDRGWHPLSAIELGMMPRDYSGDKYDVHWSFVGGSYMGYGAIGAVQPSEGLAFAMTGLVNNVRTLVVSFAGTDQAADMVTYGRFANHYALFAPLVDALKSYVNTGAVDQILVTGHSLGAGMVQMLLQEAGFRGSNVKAFTFGSPGSDSSSAKDDGRIMNFVHTDDLVPKAAEPIGTAVIESVKAFVQGLGGIWGPAVSHLLDHKVRVGSDVRIDSGVSTSINFDEHAQTLYVRDLIKIIGFAVDKDSPFSKSPLGQKLAAGTIYSGEDYHIGVGAPVDPSNVNSKYSSIIQSPLSDDNYVLGNNGNQNDIFRFDKDTIFASGIRIFDGGSGDDTVVLPTKESVKGDGKIVRILDHELQMDVKDGQKKDVWKSVGEFYRVEHIQYKGGGSDSFKSVTKTIHHDDFDLA